MAWRAHWLELIISLLALALKFEAFEQVLEQSMRWGLLPIWGFILRHDEQKARRVRSVFRVGSCICKFFTYMLYEQTYRHDGHFS